MNRDRCVGNLKQFSGRMREQWAMMIHDDAGVYAGRRTQTAGSNQERHGISNEEAARQIKAFYYRNRDWHTV